MKSPPLPKESFWAGAVTGGVVSAINGRRSCGELYPARLEAPDAASGSCTPPGERFSIAGMEATVREGQAPAVVVSLQPGERLTSEAGAMMFISGDISMDVEMPGGLMG